MKSPWFIPRTFSYQKKNQSLGRLAKKVQRLDVVRGLIDEAQQSRSLAFGADADAETLVEDVELIV